MDNMILFVVHLLFVSCCLAENIALDKPAYQIGSYGGATADKAVDGRYDRDTNDDYYLSVCAHPDTSWYGNGPAKWWVDLEATHSISKVSVWNTYNTGGYWRMNNFTVDVVTSDNKTRQSCGEYRKAEPVSPGGSYTFNCNNKQGRYVYVQRLKGSKEQQIITLCEVQVYGYLKTTLTPTLTEPISLTPATITSETSTKTQLLTVTGDLLRNTALSKPPRLINTLPWVLFGMACVIIIVLATLYIFACKKISHLSQATKQSVNTTQTTHQQSDLTISVDSIDYEEVGIRNLQVNGSTTTNTTPTGQYESLEGQISSVNTSTPYESIR